MHCPELLRKPLVGEKGALRVIILYPVEGEPDYYRAEEAEHDESPHPRHASAAPGCPRDPRRTPRITDVHARNPPALGRGGTPHRPQPEPSTLLRRYQGTGIRGRHRVGRECAIRQRRQALRHHRAGPEDAGGTRLEVWFPVV